jgi:hypothetical protein
MIADTPAAGALDDAASDDLADVIVRAAQLASDHPEVAELELNPVIVTSDGCWVVDAVLRLRPSSRPETAMRRLEGA